MKAIYGQSLVEHPGHPDQKVHGRRGGHGGKSPVTALTAWSGNRTRAAHVVITRKNRPGAEGTRYYDTSPKRYAQLVKAAKSSGLVRTKYKKYGNGMKVSAFTRPSGWGG